jgi:tetratricopeptide (TPR) repeat protein
MKNVEDTLDQRIANLWQRFDTLRSDDFFIALNALLAELPADSAIALFERACAHDSTGHPDQAAPLYQAALAAGLVGIRRRRAVIQMASSLRNLGDAERAAALLTVELRAPHDELYEAVRAFLALALADLGKEREALSLSLTALSTYLPRYNGSLARYASALVN